MNTRETSSSHNSRRVTGRRVGLPVALALAALILPAAAAAQSGVDTSFGENGSLFQQDNGTGGFAVYTSGPHAGDIVRVGGGGDQSWAGRVRVFDSDGSLDAGFVGGPGATDRLPTSYPFNGGLGGQSWRSVAITANGKIVVAGISTNTPQLGPVVLARFHHDGTLDTDSDSDPGASFGPDGSGFMTLTNGGTQVSIVRSGPGAGDLLVGGGAVTRLTADGDFIWRKDVRFGYAPADPPDDEYQSVTALQTMSDGDIVVAGTQELSYGTGAGPRQRESNAGLVLLNPDGGPDSGFTGDGLQDFDSQSAAGGLVIEPDDTVIVLVSEPWHAVSEARPHYVVRMGSDGDLDTSFGDGGYAHVPQPLDEQRTGGLAFRGGRYFVGVTGSIAGNEKLGVVRLTSAGAPDTSFGGDGVALGDAAPQSSLIYSLGPSGVAATSLGPLVNGNFTVPSSDATRRNQLTRFLPDGGPGGDDDGSGDSGDSGGIAGDVASSGRGVRVHRVVSPRTFRGLAQRGTRVLVSCQSACRAVVSVRISESLADFLGLRKTLVARGTRVLPAAKKRWVTATYSARALRALNSFTGTAKFKISVRGLAP